MEKLVEISILFDFYGGLLTEKQYQVIDLYYNNDFSLAEIGESMGISRQGVFDNIKRAEKKLFTYEEELGLVNKFTEKEKNILEIIRNSRKILESNNIEEIQEKAKDIIQIGKKLVE